MATVKLDPAKGVQIPNMTTTERDAVSSPETGALVWNTTTSAVNQYNGSAWGTVGISEDTTKLPLAGGTMTGHIYHGDNILNYWGAGNDFHIYHDGSHTRFKNDTGNLTLQSDTINLTNRADNSSHILCNSTGVGIGTASPSWKLSVKGGRSIFTDTTSYAIGVRKNSTESSNYNFWIGASATNDTTVPDLVFSNNDGTEKARILTGGGITFNGDTAAANALDDYEEGTFTPTVAAADNHTQQLGIYTKVGNLVSVFIKMQCAMSSGTCFVSGLPFTCQNTNNHYPTGSFFGVVGVENFGDGSIAPQIAPNGTVVQLYKQTNSSNNNYESFGASHVGSTVNFSISIVYST